MRVAVIGSFKQHYDAVLDAIATFRHAGWTVASPAGSSLLEPGIDFVRFSTDHPAASDPLVQTRTLVNIFTADLTYVVAPNGYVGKTTCYEIGRLVQARKPVYVSEAPDDLPIKLPEECIASAEELVMHAADASSLRWPFDIGDDELVRLERQLVHAA